MQGTRSIRKIARTIAAGAVGVALVAGVTVADHPTQAAGGLPAGKLGQYVGFDEGGRFAAAESALGRPLEWVVTMADAASPSKMRASVWGQFAKSSAHLPKLSNRLDVTVTIPLAFGKGGLYRSEGPAAVRQALSKTSSGAYDADFRVVARHLIAAGYGDAVLRLGHEFDGTWQPWSARDNEQAYIAAFRHVRNVFEKESRAFRYEWTGMHGPWRWHAPSAYPGDAYVDIIGLDIYYRRAEAIGDRQWDREYEAALVAHRDFAISKGKAVSYPEWGRARGDTSRFIDLMYGWFDSLPKSGPGSLAYQAYFNPPGQGGEYDLNNYPTVKKRYLQLFSATSSTPLRAPSTTATTTTTTTGLEPAVRLALSEPVTESQAPPASPAPPAPPKATTAANEDSAIWGQNLPTIESTLIDGQLSLSWYHPDAERYQVKYRPVGTRWWKWTKQGPSTSLTVSGLKPGTSYEVEVKMHNIPRWYPWRNIVVDPT